MPIRINLLAEAQALEELRRRDPVKRVIWIGVFLAFLVLLWSSSLQVQAIVAKGDLARLQADIGTRTNDFARVTSEKRELTDVAQRLSALQQLATNRFLNATVLNALQQVALPEVQIIRLQAQQRYDTIEVAKKPAITEHITLTIDARDTGPTPGDQLGRFKQSLATNAYFQATLGKANEPRLTSYAPVQLGSDGKPFVPFTLECRYLDKTR